MVQKLIIREKTQKAEAPISTPISSPSPTASPTPSVATFPQTTQADHPYNRYGFKYTPCRASSILKLLTYRQEDSNRCALSTTDRSPYASISRDGMVLTTDKGWRMCRASVGVRQGSWYWEATIQPGQGMSTEGPHVRLGWARREGKYEIGSTQISTFL